MPFLFTSFTPDTSSPVRDKCTIIEKGKNLRGRRVKQNEATTMSYEAVILLFLSLSPSARALVCVCAALSHF